MTINTRHRGYY